MKHRYGIPLSIMTMSITTLSITIKRTTHSLTRLLILTLHAEFYVFIVMLSVAMLNVVKLSVVMLNVAAGDKTAFGSTESFE